MGIINQLKIQVKMILISRFVVIKYHKSVVIDDNITVNS